MNGALSTMPNPATADGGTGGKAERSLDIRISDVRQIFDSRDAAPFRERDLDPELVQFVVDWAREQPRNAPLALIVHLNSVVPPTATDVIRPSAREHFRRMAMQSRSELRRLFHTGRIALVIGVLFGAVAVALSEPVGDLLGRGTRYSRLIEESMAIGAWVALWRPLEIFLYDWWPIRGSARLYDRLAEARMSIVHDHDAPLVGAA